MTAACRARWRFPNGAEFEAEGDADFIRSERTAFLAAQSVGKQDPADPAIIRPSESAPTNPGTAHIAAWDCVVETNGPHIQLRAKLTHNKTEKDACMVLLAAAQKVLNLPKPTAAQLARWLRASGYPIQRVDRAISEAISTGDILASGSRRARRYELTAPGKIKALHLSSQLASHFQ